MMLNEQEQRRLLRTLQDDPAFLAQVRSLILPAELVQLPERFAQFASEVTAFIERQEKFNERQEEFNATANVRFQEIDGHIQRMDGHIREIDGHIQRMDEHIQGMDEHIQRMDEHIQRMDEHIQGMDEHIQGMDEHIQRMDEHIQRMDEHIQRMDERFEKMDERFQGIIDDIGDLKGHVAGRVAREMADDITERLGFEIIQLLNGTDLRVMLRGHKPHDISPGVRRSFYLADMVALVEDQDGNRLYIAAEALYTADARDSQRAVRNAQFLTRFTGIDALPAVVSLRNDRDVQQLVNAGSILWFQFEARDLQPQ